ncbi:MAG: hypothetical protein SGI90_14290 [Candidatus Eisenbacteria bacterium]|nr:hypothetical protein [Candidatus Eisenbacteria bacterium]
MNRTTRSFPGRRPVAGGFRTSFMAPVLVIVGTLALASCSTDFAPDEARSEQPIKIKPGAADPDSVQSFSPNPVTVLVQTEVVWSNEDMVAHQIASVGGIFTASAPIPPGGQYRHIFLTQGTFRYYCTLPGHREAGVINVLR